MLGWGLPGPWGCAAAISGAPETSPWTSTEPVKKIDEFSKLSPDKNALYRVI